MASEADAQRYIESIRNECGLNSENEALLSQFEAVISILSSQLYDTSTHFLMELLQNADDNTYTCSVPTVRFTYEPGHLRFDCNEVGFSAANVKAIAAVGASTKSGRNKMNGFTGEKGIGFKSVFKVADVVWIASGPYKFKFDKNQRLGMIAPSWAEFPHPLLPGHTSFYFQLSKDYDERELIRDLESFDPSRLLFLRRIRKIELSTRQGRNSPWSLQLEAIESTGPGQFITRIRCGPQHLSYHVVKHRVDCLPQDIKRTGFFTTELQLAFPILNLLIGYWPSQERKDVFAYLPIGDYGLRFILQGDFLLTANRLQIDMSSKWNEFIRDALTEAFLNAVEGFAQGELKYHWPYYVPDHNTNQFFKPAQERLLNQLASKCILESFGETLRRPHDLVHVPSNFLDRCGLPFCLTEENQNRFLSPQYPAWTISSLNTLGVASMSDEQFVEDLKLKIEKNPESFYLCSDDWHADLARALIPLTSVRTCKSILLDIPLIPLKTKYWVAANDDPCFFFGDLELDDFPIEDAVSIIDPRVTAYPSWSYLFTALGIGYLEKNQLCLSICQAHSAPEFRPEQWTISQLVAQAKLLYHSSFRPPEGTDLWFATMEDKRCRGSQIYYRDHDEHSYASQVFLHLEKRFDVIHPAYGAWNPSDRSWALFLSDSLEIWKIPRLVRPKRDDSKFYELSDEFKHLFQTCHYTDLLGFLSEHWRSYSKWLEADDTEQEDSSDLLLQTIGDITVQTHLGPALLRETFLSGLDQKVQDDLLPSFKFDKPVSERQREKLRKLGIIVHDNMQYYLACLRFLCNQINPDLDMVTHIYKRVQELYDGNEDFATSSFKAQKLVYVPSKGGESDKPVGWIDITECAKQKIDPATIYPQSSELFKFLLANTGDEVEGLILKATLINKSHSLEDIGKLFTRINAALPGLNKGRIKEVMNQVQKNSIFPTTLNREDNSYDNLQSASALNWVVADRPHLRDGFAGKIPLLAFSPKEIHSLSNLLTAFELDSRRLSKLTTSRDSHIGPVRFSDTCTKFLRSRAEFFIALLPQSENDYPRLCDELKSIRIYQANKITQVSVAKYRNSEYLGSPSDGEVSLSVEDNAIHMFLTRNGLSSNTLPMEVSRKIAKHCGVDDSIHFSLLQAILSEQDTLKLQNTFAREGFFVETDPKTIQDDSSPNEIVQITDDVYLGRSGDMFALSCPFGFLADDMNADERFKRFGTEGRRGEGKRKRGVDRPDRRIPLINFTRMIQGAVLVDDELDPHRDLQYLGEAMVSTFLESVLPGIYDPKRCWTSPLKVRSGFQTFNSYHGSSSFTFRSPKESFAITEFIVRSGHPDAGSWKHMKPRYHIEVMASNSDSGGNFTWSLDKFERARRFHFQDRPNRAVEDIMVLFQISNVYSKPKFHLIVDPWQLVTSKQMAFEGDQMLGTAITVEAIRPLFNINKPRIGMTWHNGVTDNNRPHPSEMKPKEIAQPKSRSSGAPRWLRGNWRGVNSVESKAPERDQTSNPGQNRLTELSEPNPTQTDKGKPQTQLGNHVSKVEVSSTVDQPPPRSFPQEKASAHGMHGMRPFQVNHLPATLPAIAELTSPTTLSSTKYRYRKLLRNHLRFFMLFPGEQDDELQGAVYSVSFEDAGMYRTLSYVWGDTASTHTLTTPQGSISITTALMTALKTIRLTTNSVTLWIDALCINQADEVEKAFQIRLLPEIFQGAVCTLAFLGSDEDCTAAIELLLQIRAKDIIKNKPKEEWPRDLPPIDASWEKQRVPPLDANVWADVRRLFSRAWFRRSWVIQEVVVAPTVKVRCGKWMTEWHDLFAAVEIVDQEHQGLNDDLRPWLPFLRLGRHREWESRHKRLSLHRLLESYRDVDSSLKRDRFFALVGLANDGNREEFVPDYKEDFETVALRFAGGFISQGLGMKLMYRAGLTDQSDRFPSWLPDWTVPRAGSLSDSLDRGAEFDSCAGSAASIKYTPGSDEIMVRGSNVDVIVHATTIFNEPSKRRQFFLEVDKIATSIRKNPSNEDLEDTVWKTAVAGAERASYNSNQPGNISLAESYRALRSSQMNSKPGLAEKAMAYVSLLDDKVLGWRFAITKGRRCAMIPPQAETGDKVCILKGGAVPFVLRESDRIGAHRLIGECYVHGIMHGELQELLSNSLVEMRIH